MFKTTIGPVVVESSTIHGEDAHVQVWSTYVGVLLEEGVMYNMGGEDLEDTHNEQVEFIKSLDLHAVCKRLGVPS
jgi:hypothetical protein